MSASHLAAIQEAGRNRSKKVLCVELHKEFSGAREASEYLGNPSMRNRINKCCDHKKKYQTAGGYHWEYI